MNIVVVGSLNMDVVNRVEKHPLPGETIKGKGTEYIPGGKGANQAVAASRANASVRMVGAVGKDGFGKQLVASLNQDGIDTTNVLVKDGTSGIAFITVNDQGENNIILSEGANGALTTEDIQSIADALLCDAVLVQNEIPLETTYETIRAARGRATRIYYNPAPAHPVPKEILQMIDVLVLNETEASVVLNRVLTTHKEYVDAAKELVFRGAKAVILTLGPEGAIFVNEHQSVRVPAFQVSAVDTTAAGDTFIGAFASVYKGDNAMESLRYASAASAITVTRAGAQISIPTGQEIEEFLKRSS
ncbi:ribokinase [Alicyclobacillus fastidiosus]|uniref:Ribokinase n=1 Tax=Alicyclobacillus fastidiosus TaxID=392011 RepID=A0ABV5AHR3_9BACL|nr:ribokinase [Alicyclobacillus fastidiosus]WEH07966.1 ribokinase [Alicyclobacillus fastidiosus]